MNTKRIKLAADNFYRQYPGGMNHPDMLAVRKKHRMDKMMAMVQEFFPPDVFENIDSALEHYIKTVTSSSMVSLFEKPRSRDYLRVMEDEDKLIFISGLRELLHGDERTGFEAMVDMLGKGKLAKWTLVTAVPAYYRPSKDVFMKPTTVKGIISYFELEYLHYRPRPDFDFYRRYRDAIAEMKNFVADDLKPNNAAFSGFLMMSLPDRTSG